MVVVIAVHVTGKYLNREFLRPRMGERDAVSLLNTVSIPDCLNWVCQRRCSDSRLPAADDQMPWNQPRNSRHVRRFPYYIMEEHMYANMLCFLCSNTMPRYSRPSRALCRDSCAGCSVSRPPRPTRANCGHDALAARRFCGNVYEDNVTLHADEPREPPTLVHVASRMPGTFNVIVRRPDGGAHCRRRAHLAAPSALAFMPDGRTSATTIAHPAPGASSAKTVTVFVGTHRSCSCTPRRHGRAAAAGTRAAG